MRTKLMERSEHKFMSEFMVVIVDDNHKGLKVRGAGDIT